MRRGGEEDEVERMGRRGGKEDEVERMGRREGGGG